MGIGSGSLLCAVTIRPTGTSYTRALLVAGAGLGTQLTHLLGKLATGEIWIGLTGHSCGTCGLLTSRFSMFGHRITSGKNQCSTGVLDGATLWTGRASLTATAQLKGRGRTRRQLSYLSRALTAA